MPRKNALSSAAQKKPRSAGRRAAACLAAGMGVLYSGCLNSSGANARTAVRYNEAAVEFSQPGGFYDKSFSVKLSYAVPGAVIKYSLDASSPSEKDGLFYTAPIDVKTTAIIRAMAYKTGTDPSAVGTRTYIFPAEVKKQSRPTIGPWPKYPVTSQALDFAMDPRIVNRSEYGPRLTEALLFLPSVSLVSDHRHLFDSWTGIYVNPLKRGRDWERPVSVEFLFPGSAGKNYQINGGARIRGGWSRLETNPKHSFHLFFRPTYGEKRLGYPLFGKEGVDKFDKLDLSTSQNYAWAKEGDRRNTMVREVFSRDVMGAMGQPYTKSRFVHLYLNGCYWGVFQTQERPDAYFAQSYLGGKREDYDVVKVKCGPDTGEFVIELTDGNLDAYRELNEAMNRGFAKDEQYYFVLGRNSDGTPNPKYKVMVDEDNLIDFMLVVFYTGNFDAPVTRFRKDEEPNNFYGLYDRNGRAGWKFVIHDAEHSMLDLQEDRTGHFLIRPSLRAFNPGYLHQKLLAHPEYRMKFVDHVYRHFYNNGVFVPENALRLMQKRVAELDLAMIAESARWGDAHAQTPLTYDDWRKEVNFLLKSYIPSRTDIVLRQFKNKKLYPSIEPPRILGTGQGKKYPRPMSISNPNAAGTVYYTLDGRDPRERGGRVAAGAISASGDASISLTAPTTVKARVKTGDEWSALEEAAF